MVNENKVVQWLRQKIRRHPFIATGIIVVLIALTAFVFLVHMFGWDWTGFNGGYSKTTTTSTTHGITTTTEQPLTKTLWDWLQLLIIPVVLVIAGFWLNQIQKSREQKTTQEQAKLERELTHDNQQEILLQAYIDKVSELLLEKNLRKSELGAEVRNIARARTLTVLPRLNAGRKESVLSFLYESGLIHKGKSIIDLNGANLTEADLIGADLSGVDLSRTNLTNAVLSGVNLTRADLSGADLTDAHLLAADLSEANLSEATISRAIFRQANLHRANLNQTGHVITLRFDLLGVNLVEANLAAADLREADLSRAILSGANLKDATGITVEELEKQAKSLQGAIMPDGSIHP